MSTQVIGANLRHQRIAAEREASPGSGALEGEEALVVRRKHQHDGDASHLIVHASLPAQAIPVVRLGLVIQTDAHHPRLIAPGKRVGACQLLATRAPLVGVVLRVVVGKRRVALHYEGRRMKGEPALERHLHTGNLGQRSALAAAGDGFAVGLAPPASRRFILEHGVELVHAHQPESLHLAFHHRREHSARATDGAITDQHLLSAHGVAHLMVIADELQRIGPRITIDFDSDHEAIGGHSVPGGRRHGERRGLTEHLVGRQAKVEEVGDDAGDRERRRNQPLPPTGGAPGRQGAHTDQHPTHHANRPAPLIQRVRHVEAAHPLAARHRHDEIDVGDLEDDQSQHTDGEQLLQGTRTPA